MTVATRRQKIEEMLLSEPNDVFLRYSLAMELSKEGLLDQSLGLLRELSDGTPRYVPAFFRAAQLLAEHDDFDSARTFLREGIEEARAQGDQHAAAEMGEMLSDLGAAG